VDGMRKPGRGQESSCLAGLGRGLQRRSCFPEGVSPRSDVVERPQEVRHSQQCPGDRATKHLQQTSGREAEGQLDFRGPGETRREEVDRAHGLTFLGAKPGRECRGCSSGS
jgi:hypothetical protein